MKSNNHADHPKNDIRWADRTKGQAERLRASLRGQSQKGPFPCEFIASGNGKPGPGSIEP